MRPHVLVLVLAVMLAGCFSTAPYDRVHLARVAEINARFAAASELEQLRYARELAEPRAAIEAPRVTIEAPGAAAPGASVPRGVAPDATAGGAAGPTVLDITFDAGDRAEHYRQRLAALERERLAAVRASLRQRDTAINDARTARRARVRAAADQAPLDPELRVTRW